MKENKQCPLCNSEFNIEDKSNVIKTLAYSILLLFKKMQDREDSVDNLLPCCPRCGGWMIPGIHRNALSRSLPLMICPICGVDEAVRVYSGNILPFDSWWAVREILNEIETTKKECDN